MTKKTYDIPDMFRHIPESSEDTALLASVRKSAARLASAISRLPESAEQDAAFSRLQESVAWAERSLIRRPDNQDREAERQEIFDRIAKKFPEGFGDMKSLANLLGANYYQHEMAGETDDDDKLPPRGPSAGQ